MDLSKVMVPTLLLDKPRTLKNIERMISKCRNSRVILRPHFKTHQSLEVGRWYRDLGIDKITVSSTTMAEYFANDGWNDILIAFPFNPREIDKINNLAKRINLTLTIPNIESARSLASSLTSRLNVMIKVDTGYGRSGIEWDSLSLPGAILTALESNTLIQVIGLLTHSGHTYQADRKEMVESIFMETVERMNFCRNNIPKSDLLVSVGDTPSASIVSDYTGVDELRPGNFVFYDLMQYQIGSCRLEDISVVAACPIVDIQDNRKRVIIYGGGVHLSKESVTMNGEKVYGMIVKLNDRGWEISDKQHFIKSLSQEHGIIEFKDKLPEEFGIGSLIGIIPVHSCLTSNLLDGYTLLTDEYVDHMNSLKN